MNTLVSSALAAALLLTASPTLAAPAQAAAPTCQGQPATVVGRPGATLTGTAGPDVVVTRGASQVITGDGADVVCVTGRTKDGKRVEVRTEAGDDSVVVTGADAVRAFLGDGDDRFAGGDEVDVVWAGHPDSYDYGHVDDGTDSIRTGGGDDQVRSAFGDDLLNLGTGDDVLVWEARSGHADGGRGADTVLLNAYSSGVEQAGSWVLDNRRGTLSKDGTVRMTWSGFARFRVGSAEPLTILGSEQDEVFTARGAPLIVAAAGGDDVVEIDEYAFSAMTGVAGVDGGRGRDGIVVRSYRDDPDRAVLVDLTDHRYRSTGSGGTREFDVTGIEDAEVSDFPQVTLRGSRAANRLTVHPADDEGETFSRCAVALTGAGGDDTLRVVADPLISSTAPQPQCPVRLRGNAGDDVLTGSRVDDVLVGGPGRDVARGRAGRDRCDAEVVSGCERR